MELNTLQIGYEPVIKTVDISSVNRDYKVIQRTTVAIKNKL